MKTMNQYSQDERTRYVNLPDAMNRLRGNEKIYRTLLKTFDANTYMAELLSDIEKNDLETAAKTAHKIKGVTGNLSLDEAHSAIVLLESQLKNGLEYQDALQKLGEVMQKTMEFVNIMLEE